MTVRRDAFELHEYSNNVIYIMKLNGGLNEISRRWVDPQVFVYAAGGYYYPGKDVNQFRDEMRSYLDRGYTVVKMKIGNDVAEDRPCIEGVLRELDGQAQLAVDANRCLCWRTPSHTPRCCAIAPCSGTRRRATRSTSRCRRRWRV